MAFGTNYENIPQGGGELVPEGFYECIITNAEIRKTQNGKYKVGFMLTIRNDIQQPCANRVLFLDIWRKREPTPADEQVDGFNFAQLMAVSRAAKIPSGQNFESLEQFLQALTGRLLIAEVRHEEYNGKPQVRVDSLSTAPAQFPECRHVQKQRPQAQNPAYGSPAPRQQQGYAQRPQQGYAPQQQYQQPPMQQGYAQPQRPQAAPPAPGPMNVGNLDEFEEILSSGEVPF